MLVRRHGLYVWGESWEKAKSMAECYDYLLELTVKVRNTHQSTSTVCHCQYIVCMT